MYIILVYLGKQNFFVEIIENISANVATKVAAMKNTVPTGEMYLEICDNCLKSLSNGNYSYDTFPGLSDKAWITSNEVNQQIKYEKNHTIFIMREMKSPENSLGDAEVTTKHIWLFTPGKNAVMWD